METKIYIAKAWGKERQDRYGVIVDIENNGTSFKFMPTYEHIKQISELLEAVELLNKDKCKGG